MATSIVSPAAGSRIGPGTSISYNLGGTSVAGDRAVFVVKVGGVTQYATVIMEEVLPAGLHSPTEIIGWDYILNQYILPTLGGIADGTAVTLDVTWLSSALVVKGTSTTAFVWDACGQASFLLNFLIGQDSALLNLILQRVTNNLPKLP